jgi:hypothetical protein
VTKTAPVTPEQAYWLWHNSEPLANVCVDSENVAGGPNYWQRMLAAGRQAVADRKEERALRRELGEGT